MNAQYWREQHEAMEKMAKRMQKYAESIRGLAFEGLDDLLAQERKHTSITRGMANKIREEYRDNPSSTIEFLSDKHGTSVSSIRNVLYNKIHNDPNYIKPEKAAGGKKKAVFLPDHVQKAKDELIPQTQTAHRARGNAIGRNPFH
jgi:hypothetical protein